MIVIAQYPLPGRGCHEVAGEEFGQLQLGSDPVQTFYGTPAFLIRLLPVSWWTRAKSTFPPGGRYMLRVLRRCGK